MQTWYQENKTLFTDEQQSTLEENYGGGGFAGGFLAGMFGVVFGGGDYNHYKNQQSTEVQSTDSTQSGFLEKVSQLTVSAVTVSGSIQITSTDDLPKEADIFIEATTIKFTDNNNKTVTVSAINTSNPVAATSSGSTSGLTTSGGNLTMVPVS